MLQFLPKISSSTPSFCEEIDLIKEAPQEQEAENTSVIYSRAGSALEVNFSYPREKTMVSMALGAAVTYSVLPTIVVGFAGAKSAVILGTFFCGGLFGGVLGIGFSYALEKFNWNRVYGGQPMNNPPNVGDPLIINITKMV